jgi:hypothetical protein
VITADVLPVGAFLIVGVGCLVCAVWLAWRERWRVRNWCVREGVVVDPVEVADIDGVYRRTAVEFTDLRGERIRVVSSWGSTRPKHKKGDVVQVCYPPEKPTEAQVIGEWRRVTVWVGVAGLVISLLAARLLASMLR